VSTRPQTENLTRYLLGELPEDERARLEDELLGDEALFRKVEEAEHDLLDDYVGGRLPARERERFEQHYLRLPGSPERLHTARLIAREREAQTKDEVVSVSRAEPARPGLFEALRAFWRGAMPSFTPYALGLAAVALFVGAVWWAVTRGAGNDAPQVAKAIPEATPFPDWKGTQTSINSRPNVNRDTPTPEPTRAPQAKPSPTPAARPREEQRGATAVLALVAGLTRGGEGANRLTLPRGAGAVRLEFNLGEGSYKDVRASLRTVEGREVWSGALPPKSGRKAALTLPARVFSSDDYLLILSGTGASGERVEFQEFYFNTTVK
jgi:hypothetical protein